MKVCHVLATVDDPSAGPSYSVPGLADGLAKLGHAVVIHTVAGWRSSSAAVAGEGVQKGMPVIRRHAWTGSHVPIFSSLAWSEEMRKALGREAVSADILHGHGLWLMPNVFPSWVVGRGGRHAKLVVAPRGMLGEAALQFSSTKKTLFWTLLQKRALNAATCFHATSESEAAEIRTAGFRQPIAVIPNGIVVPPAGREILSGTRPRSVISLGRIHPKKGLDRLLHAWSKVEATHETWRLRIIGPDEDGTAKDLEVLGRALGLTRVSIEDPVFGLDKQTVLQQSDLFVLPTLNENFAITVAEALAAGVPVISTKGAPWSGLVARRCGWWIDHGVDPLVVALDEAMSLEDDQRLEMGENGRRWMDEAFSWRSIATSMAEVYEWLLRGERQPSHVFLG